MTLEELVEILNKKTACRWSIVRDDINYRTAQIKAERTLYAEAYSVFISTKVFDIAWEVLKEYPGMLIESLTEKTKEVHKAK